jgi:hypothetical protein
VLVRERVDLILAQPHEREVGRHVPPVGDAGAVVGDLVQRVAIRRAERLDGRARMEVPAVAQLDDELVAGDAAVDGDELAAMLARIAEVAHPRIVEAVADPARLAARLAGRPAEVIEHELGADRRRAGVAVHADPWLAAGIGALAQPVLGRLDGRLDDRRRRCRGLDRASRSARSARRHLQHHRADAGEPPDGRAQVHAVG